MENSEVNDYLDTLDETIDVDDETSDSLLGQESGLFAEEVATPQAPVVSMDTLPITGEARVDDALGRLADLQGLPVHEHVAVFEDVQRRLHETLADLAGQ
jgi:CBS-domain-containing membrane protein